MDNGWNLFNNGSGSTGRGQNSNCTNLAWDIWDLGWSSATPNNFFHHHSTTAGTSVTAAPATTLQDASEVHALMFPHHSSSSSIYTGGGSQYHPDPHLMCLKLGKRHYFGDATPLSDRHVAAGFSSSSSSSSSSITKRGRPYFSVAGDVGGGFVGPSTSAVASPATVPRCQVEGCHVALVNAKEYHRRHKVCEMHSKAPKVVVLGIEQRFCQQCSRFHAVTEFDETKRSCRRRLAGHNERRRKSSHDSITRNPSQGRALSLLSSKNNPLISSTDLSSRCSAALRELIAENRAAILARQLILDRDWPYWSHHSMEDLNGTQPGSNSNPLVPSQHQMVPEPHGWQRFSEAGSHLTLDLMQGPSSAFGFLSMREKSKDEEDECSDELWSSFGGAHVV